jgi:RNA-binding protein YhbY
LAIITITNEFNHHTHATTIILKREQNSNAIHQPTSYHKMPTWKGLKISVLTLLLLCKIVGGFSPNSLIQRKNIAVSKPSIVLFSQVDNEAQEKVWRYVKKPLLSIGSKGASLSHGNSLRQLLEDHTAVKVKVNTKPFGTSECTQVFVDSVVVTRLSNSLNCLHRLIAKCV